MPDVIHKLVEGALRMGDGVDADRVYCPLVRLPKPVGRSMERFL
jgi:hypothetical protein